MKVAKVKDCGGVNLAKQGLAIIVKKYPLGSSCSAAK